MEPETLASGMAERLRLLRRDLFGEHGAPLLADRLGITTLEWLDYESGQKFPTVILMRLVEATPVDLIWLLRGRGARYRQGSLAPPRRAAIDAAATAGPRPAPAPPPPPRPGFDSPLVGRRARVPAWDELREVLDVPPLGIVRQVFDFGRGPIFRIQGDGFDLTGDFAPDEVEILA